MRVPGQSSDNSKASLKGVDGLNNRLDPMRGGPSSQGVAPRTWQLLSEADNINITDANLMVRRDGYEPFIPGSNITSSFTTFAHDRFYVIDNGTLAQVTQDGELIPLASNLSGPARQLPHHRPRGAHWRGSKGAIRAQQEGHRGVPVDHV